MEDLLEMCNNCYGQGTRPHERKPDKEVECGNCAGTGKTLTEAGDKLSAFLSHCGLFDHLE